MNLAEKIKLHNLYLFGDSENGKYFDLQGEDLSFTDLRANLDYCNLKGAFLIGADLRGFDCFVSPLGGGGSEHSSGAGTQPT